MNRETRMYLLALTDESSMAWLSVEDEGSNFKMQARTQQQTYDMLSHAYGLNPFAKETLKVHLEGEAAELAGVDKSLEAVQIAVRNLFAETPFNIELKLTGVESGSTVLVYEPAEQDVEFQRVLGDKRVEVASSQADRAATEAIDFLLKVEDHRSQNDRNAVLQRARQLSQELIKLGLEAEFAWQSCSGNMSFARFTRRGAEYLGQLGQMIESAVTRIGVQGLITEVALVGESLYKVTVRKSLAPRARKSEVLISINVFKGLGKFIGDRVSWTVEETVSVNGFGETVEKRLQFFADGIEEAEPGLFSVEEEN